MKKRNNISRIKICFIAGAALFALFYFFGVGETEASTSSGTLSCSTVDSNTIRVSYSVTNGSSASLFRGTSRIVDIGSGNNSRTIENTNLYPDTSYTFYLRNGIYSTSPLLATATCRTDSALTPICGSCGTRAGTYEHNQTSWPSGTFCSAGTPSPSNPLFPSAGSTTTWICRGLDGGEDVTCSATRKSAPAPEGKIECYGATRNSITLKYDFSEGSEVSIFRGLSRLEILGSGSKSGFYTHEGLSSDTSYSYSLRNGRFYTSLYLDSVSCSTLPKEEESPWGVLHCDLEGLNSIRLMYSYAEGSDVSLFRGGNRLITWYESSRSNRAYEDTGLSSDTGYTYYLRNGIYSTSPLLATAQCRTNYESYDPRMTVVKMVRNNTRNTGWGNAVEAAPGHSLSFSIEVRSTGDGKLENVIVKDILPEKTQYVGNLMVDGIARSGNIAQGINIGDISSGFSKTLTFDVLLSGEGFFGVGWTNLTNIAEVSASNVFDTDTAEIYVSRGVVAGAATRVVTGITNNKLIDFILLPLLATILIWIFFRKYFIGLSEWLENKKISAFDSRAKRNLSRITERIKTREHQIRSL